MSALDLQAEYDNRARVPEHPGIIAGWGRDASAYREAIGSRYSVQAYGDGERQRIHRYAPERDGASALVVFVHGGYWRSLEPALFSHLARGLNARGVAVAMPGYDLCPGIGLPALADQVRAACALVAREGRPLVVAGHSAGGHLAACMTATDWRAFDATLTEDPVAAGYAISGLFDLDPLLHTDVNGALRLDAAGARAMSPLYWPAPAGKTFDAVVGGAESSEYHRQSRTLAEVWGGAGVGTRYEAIGNENHFTVVAPLADPESPITARLAALAAR